MHKIVIDTCGIFTVGLIFALCGGETCAFHPRVLNGDSITLPFNVSMPFKAE